MIEEDNRNPRSITSPMIEEDNRNPCSITSPMINDDSSSETSDEDNLSYSDNTSSLDLFGSNLEKFIEEFFINNDAEMNGVKSFSYIIKMNSSLTTKELKNVATGKARLISWVDKGKQFNV